jgi:translation factor GUF1, mitochondrial
MINLEYSLSLYQVVYKDRTRIISNPTQFPDVQDPRTQVVEVQEPMVKASIIVPHGTPGHHPIWFLLICTTDYLGEMIDLCTSHRAEELDHKFLDVSVASSRIMISCIIPLSEIVTDFFDKLKSRSSGFASFELSV